MCALKNEIVPSKDQMMGWINEIYNQGIRRPGYSADEWTEMWIKTQLESYGVEDIKFDPISIRKWEAEGGDLKVWLKEEPEKKFDIPFFPTPYSKATDGIETELKMISEKKNLSGNIAVFSLNMLTLPTAQTKFIARKGNFYDPKNEFGPKLKQMLPFSLKCFNSMEGLEKNEASALIGILENYPSGTHDYYVPYDGVEGKKPAIWVNRKNGKIITDLMVKGKVKARLSYTGKISDAISNNITGILPSNSDEWIIIGTHHDGPWGSAVEDASGIALVLAQAEYWSKIPLNERPFNLMFLFTGAHMAGGKGTRDFPKKNPELMKKTVTAIHLEHVARDYKVENEKMMPIDAPMTRMWFTTKIRLLRRIVMNAIIQEDLSRSIIVSPDIVPGMDDPPSDGAQYFLEGVPLVSLISAPPYLFDSADTPEMVHQESLESISRATIRIIDGLKDQTADGLRKQELNFLGFRKRR
ncbi:MAG: M28 family peptidase [archaeon]|nr:M28 family peptidase [archaeon]